MWYRIERNQDGSIGSCVEVEGSSKGNRTVHYIEATSKEEAIKKLADQYDKKQAHYREADKRRRQKKAAAGICRLCPAPAMKGYARCAACLARDKVYGRRYKLRASGLNVPRLYRPAAVTPEEKAAALMRQNASAAYHSRIKGGTSTGASKARALRSALAEFDQRTPAGFRRWLVNEIKRYEAEQAAAGQRAMERRAPPAAAAQ